MGYLGVYLPTLIQPLDRAIPTVDRISVVNCTNGPVDAPYFSSPPDKNPPPVAKHQKEITSSCDPFHHWNSHLDLAKGSIFLSSLHRPAYFLRAFRASRRWWRQDGGAVQRAIEQGPRQDRLSSKKGPGGADHHHFCLSLSWACHLSPAFVLVVVPRKTSPSRW